MPIPATLPSLAPPVSQFFRAPQGGQDQQLADWLNAGGRTPAPQPVPATDEWTPEDYQVAALSGDPMGVRDLVNKYHAADDEQEFMKGLSKIDWSASPEKRSPQINDLLSKAPRGLTNQSLSYMRTMEELNKEHEAKNDPYARAIAGGGPQALTEYRAAVAAGMEPLEAYSLFQAKQDKAKADKAAESAGMLTYISHGGTTEDWNAGLTSGKTGPKMLEDQNQEKRNTPKEPTLPEALKLKEFADDYKSGAKKIDVDKDAKKAAFQAKYGREPITDAEWTDAYWLANEQRRKGAEKTLMDALDPFIKSHLNVSPYLPPGASVPTAEPVAAPIAPTSPIVPAPPQVAVQATQETAAQRLLRQSREALKR